VKNNPWETINESPPEFQIGDIVYSFITLGDQFIGVPARDLPLWCFAHIERAEVVGYEIGESIYEKPPLKFPLYRVKTLEILMNCFTKPLIEVGKEHTVNRWWVEQGDDAYRRYFKKSPRHALTFSLSCIIVLIVSN
jgi:hypothetical protein